MAESCRLWEYPASALRLPGKEEAAAAARGTHAYLEEADYESEDELTGGRPTRSPLCPGQPPPGEMRISPKAREPAL